MLSVIWVRVCFFWQCGSLFGVINIWSWSLTVFSESPETFSHWDPRCQKPGVFIFFLRSAKIFFPLSGVWQPWSRDWMTELPFSAFVQQSWLSRRRWSLQCRAGVLSSLNKMSEKEGHKEKERTWMMSSFHTSHPPSVWKTTMLLFFWVMRKLYAAFQPSFLFHYFNLTAGFGGFECSAIKTCWWLRRGCVLFMTQWCDIQNLRDCQQRCDCCRQRESKHSCSAGCSDKQPCGWCQCSNQNHRSHICVHANPMISRD